MLDQNTDRMWYVIGAVLIGAAIIFGMNTLMPNAFASVNDNFQAIISKVEIPNNNLIARSNRIIMWGYPRIESGHESILSYKRGVTRFELPNNHIEYGVDYNAVVKPNTLYKEVVHMRTDSDIFTDPEISLYSSELSHLRVNTTLTKVGDGSYIIEGIGRTRNDQTEIRGPNFFIEFEDGTYVEFSDFSLVELEE